MDHDRIHEDLRGDIWCFVMLAMISLAIAAIALVWLTIQQGEISHLQHLVQVQTYQNHHR
jgi:hypothetical protein